LPTRSVYPLRVEVRLKICAVKQMAKKESEYFIKCEKNNIKGEKRRKTMRTPPPPTPFYCLCWRKVSFRRLRCWLAAVVCSLFQHLLNYNKGCSAGGLRTTFYVAPRSLRIFNLHYEATGAPKHLPFLHAFFFLAF
jgi:hypothetical protein